MDVNGLTYNLYKLLFRKGWRYIGKHDDKFIFLIPNEKAGLSNKFFLKLPISSKSKDFYNFYKEIFILLKNIYPDNKKLLELEYKNELMKNRYSTMWIIPEEKSKIKKINKAEVFIPKNIK